MTKPGAILRLALTDCDAFDARRRRVLISNDHRMRYGYGKAYAVLTHRLTLAHGETSWYVEVKAGNDSDL